MRIAVEAWSPDYGAEADLGGPAEATVEQVDVTCEGVEWRPVSAPRGPDELGGVAFVDGTERIDARLFVTPNGSGPLSGLAGSVGAGSVLCHPLKDGAGPRAEIERITIRRLLAVGAGTPLALSAGGGLEYRQLPVPGVATDELAKAIHGQMRNLEAMLAQELADAGHLVFLDGPLAVMRPGPQRIVGFIKAHHRRYLSSTHEGILAALACGERTPLFSFGEPRGRYSWYLRLCPRGERDHEWHGLVRCETPAAVPLEEVRMLADASARLLPRFASEPHWDPRAPQNLVPVAGLEKRMRHLLGDRDLVYRMIRDAAARTSEGESVA